MSSTTSNLKNINFMSQTRFDNLSEIKDDELYAVKVDGLTGEELINQNPEGEPVKIWTGTKAEYDDLEEIDPYTLYNITDDDNITQSLLEMIYPVGSIYIGTMSVCPLSALFGTWTKIGTKILTDVSGSNSVPVKGNGKQLGFTDGTSDLVADTYSSYYAHFSKGSGLNVGAATAGDNPSVTYKAIGVTTDSIKSGIIADISNSLTTTSITVNIWRRVG